MEGYFDIPSSPATKPPFHNPEGHAALKMLSGYCPFVQGDIMFIERRGYVVTGFSGAAGDPITTVELKLVK